MGITYITVHGTGDGEREPTVGEPPKDVQWWRPESPFCQELLAAAPEGSTIEPFAWSGANEEADRRAAAERLLKRCKDAEKAGEQLHLVGHSHGGSVIATALRYAAAERRKLPALVAFTTVGTPFLKLRQKWMPWDRYDALGRAALAFMIIGLALIGYWLTHLDTLFSDLYLGGGVVAEIVGGASLFVLGRSRRGIHSRRVANRFARFFAQRWVGVSSAGDEAIGGLTQLGAIRAKLFQRDMFSAFVSSAVQFAVLGYIVALWCVAVLETPPENTIFDTSKKNPLHFLVEAHGWLFQRAWDASNAVAGVLNDVPALSDLLDFLPTLVLATSMIGGYLIALFLAMRIAEFVSEYLIGAPVAALLNGAVRGAVVGLGYGAAKVREAPNGIASSPFLDEPHVEPLPDEIDAKVLTFARDSLASTFLASHHELFRVDPASSEGISLAQAAMRHVSWGELVHTAYFRVPECRAHLISKIAARPA